MSKQNVKKNESLVSYWQQKLDWYMQEATVEEYDEEEVRAIESILEIVESEKELDETYYNAEKGLERFKATLGIRLKIQDEMRRLQAGEVSLADYPDDEEVIQPVTQQVIAARKSVKKHFNFRFKGFRKVTMAASLVAALLVGGTVGAYAQREGFFQIVNGGEDKEAVITIPSYVVHEPDKYAVYEDVKDIPIHY